MHHRYFVIAAAAAIATPCFTPPASAQDNVLVRVIHGVATTATGQPLARTRLFLYGPPGDRNVNTGGDVIVMTDDQGRFQRRVAKRHLMIAEPGKPGPTFMMLPLDNASWTASPLPDAGGNFDSNVQDILSRSSKMCVTKWLTGGEEPSISLVAPEMSSIVIALRDPNGKALANHAVEVVAPNDNLSYQGGALIYHGVTDGLGRLRMLQYPGLQRLEIAAPGVGYVFTGYFDAPTNTITSPLLPPLAPFGRISGTVAQELRGPAGIVSLQRSSREGFAWLQTKRPIDAQGRFTLADIPGGEIEFTIHGNGHTIQRSVRLHPGEIVPDVKFEMQPWELSPAAPTTVALLGGVFTPAADASEDPSSAVSGHVTDIAGHPVANADVYALYQSYDGHRIGQQTLTTKTGADGAFSIVDLPKELNGSVVMLYAFQAGHPLASTPAEPNAGTTPITTPKKFHGNLIVPDGHSGLVVCVLQDGKPMGGASVRATRHLEQGWFDEAIGSRGTSANLTQIIAPTATTDANGEARFENLTPGLWDITASSTEMRKLADSAPRPSYQGVGSAVAVGGDTMRRFTMNVAPTPELSSYHVLTPSGQIPDPGSVGFGIELLSRSSGGGFSGPLDEHGNRTVDLSQNGLWRVSAIYHNPLRNGAPQNVGPYDIGIVYSAVSPAIPMPNLVPIRTSTHPAGRLRVRLFDANGQAMRGSVVIRTWPFEIPFAGSVDASGEVLFSDLTSGNYSVQAYSNGSTPPNIGKDGDALPSDNALKHVAVLISTKASVSSGDEARVDIHPTPEGYIRGKIADADDPKNYNVYINHYEQNPAAVHYDRNTGEFIAGPFPKGEVPLRVQRVTGASGDAQSSGRNWPVTVVPGQVVHVTLKTERNTPAPPLLTQFSPRILLSDGVTPAWGAHIAVFTPDSVDPAIWSQADPAGHLSPRYESRFLGMGPAAALKPGGDPTETVVIAWLPGNAGAAILPYSPVSRQDIVLPAPISTHGRITVGEESVSRLNSTFRILAAYQGRGKLNVFLNVDTTAQADGSFDLSGLTPGTYKIQAARDGIWLSETKTVIVGNGALPDLDFDIGAPGAATIVHLRNAQGKPIGVKSVRVARPTGPLTDILWPDTFPVDPAGDVRLEGLEAGPHQISAGDGKGRVRLSKPFAVPAFTESAPMTEVTVALPGD
ncbi:MAG: carboxypeptidase-like regulatory domain-containing protein [Capsulimonas sp.]|uniref:carboxypeptidase-like regulatory domain-containing protein n=1 Tax=Capsulimonas sp. TaxID=2494211 RepID=UPI0032635503